MKADSIPFGQRDAAVDRKTEAEVAVAVVQIQRPLERIDSAIKADVSQAVGLQRLKHAAPLKVAQDVVVIRVLITAVLENHRGIIRHFGTFQLAFLLGWALQAVFVRRLIVFVAGRVVFSSRLFVRRALGKIFCLFCVGLFCVGDAQSGPDRPLRALPMGRPLGGGFRPC